MTRVNLSDRLPTVKTGRGAISGIVGRSRKQRMKQRTITASEVGEYVFCARAWRLRKDGVTPESPRLKEGARYHTRYQSALDWEHLLRLAGVLMLVLVVVVILFRLIMGLWF